MALPSSPYNLNSRSCTLGLAILFIKLVTHHVELYFVFPALLTMNSASQIHNMPAHNKSRGQRGGKGHGQAGPSDQAAQQPAAYDGPPESPGRGRADSTRGEASARAVSQPRRDPALDPIPVGQAPVLVKNVDFGGQAYDIFSKVRECESHRVSFPFTAVVNAVTVCRKPCQKTFMSREDFAL